MGTRTEHPPGTFCWVNHSTPDLAGATSYYGALFGWEFEDRTNGGQGFWMARRHGTNVAALYPREEQERAQGLPPHWNNYVSVADTDIFAARAVELGGTVAEGPFDVSDAGRTAVLIDPTGAMFWIWQPRAHIGAGRVNDPGCLVWNELSVADPERALAFYSTLFGWTFERHDLAHGGAYWVISNPGSGRNGGVREVATGDAPDSARAWIPYFAVESVDVTAAAATAAGSEVHRGPGRPDADALARIEDPTGAVHGLYQGPVDT